MALDLLQWGQFVGLIGVFCLIIYVPGLWLAYLAGERGSLAWAIAPPLTLSVTAVAALGGAATGTAYGFAPVLIALAGASVVAAIVGAVSGRWRWTRRNPDLARTVPPSGGRVPVPDGTPPWVNLKLAVVVGAAVALVTLIRIAITIKHPWAPSQTYDAVYHLNALALIRDTANASPFAMNFTSAISNGFYPNAWHQVASLVTPWVADIPTVANAWAVTTVVVVWPISVASFVWVISHGSWRLTGTAVLLSQALPQFPQMFFTFGTLYPNLLGFTLVPAVVALGYDILYHRTWRPALAGIGVALLAAPGLLLAHPLTLILIGFNAAAVLGPWLAQRWWRRFDRFNLAPLAVGALITAVLVTGIYYAAGQVPSLAKMQEYDPAGWLPTSANLLVATVKAGTLAAGTWFAHSFWGSALLGLVALYGAWVALRQPRWHALILTHLLMVILFIVADGDWNHQRRAWLTGFFYTDPMRFAAVLAISALPLVILGADQLALRVSAWAKSRPRRRERTAAPTRPRRYLYAVAAVTVVSQILPGYFALAEQTQEAYGLSDDGAGQVGMLTADEYRLLKRVDETIPEGDTVLGNPWTGTAYVWALADRRAIFPSLSGYTTDDDYFLATATNTLKREPQGCAEIRSRRAYWVLDFGHEYLWGGQDPSQRYRYYYGLEKLPESQVAQVVDSEGAAKLLRITACDRQ